MSMILGLWTAFKGLAFVSKFLGFAKWFGGPLIGILSMLVDLVVKAVKKVIEGTISILGNPVETFAVVILLLIACAFGLKQGYAWSKYKTARVEAKLESIVIDLKGADNADAKLAAVALRARWAAEKAEAGRIRSELIELEAALALQPVTANASVLGSPSNFVSHVRVRDAKAPVYRAKRKSVMPYFPPITGGGIVPGGSG